MHGEAAAAQVGAVDDVVVHERGGVDELDDRGIQHGAIALVAAQPGRHQEHGGAHALAAAALDVAAHLGNERNARLDVADELLLDRLEVTADGFEDLRQVGGDRDVLRCVGQWKQP